MIIIYDQDKTYIYNNLSDAKEMIIALYGVKLGLEACAKGRYTADTAVRASRSYRTPTRSGSAPERKPQASCTKSHRRLPRQATVAGAVYGKKTTFSEEA